MTSLVVQRPYGGRVAIPVKPLRKMMTFGQKEKVAPEAGGILLGRLLVDTDDVVVDLVTCPSTHDRRSSAAFYRSKEPTQALINAFWRRSHYTCNYLGEWHTHPTRLAKPSAHDLRNWNRIVSKAHYEQGFLLFVIVGTSETAMWEHRSCWDKPIRLDLYNEQRLWQELDVESRRWSSRLRL